MTYGAWTRNCIRKNKKQSLEGRRVQSPEQIRAYTACTHHRKLMHALHHVIEHAVTESKQFSVF